MKNISIFIPTLGAGGAEKQAALLANVLSDRYIVHFVVLYGESESSYYVQEMLNKNNIKTHKLSGNILHKYKEYIKILKNNKITCAFNYLTKCDVLGDIAALRAGHITVYNGIRNSELDGWKVVLEKFCHNFLAKATIFNCYSGEKYSINRGFNPTKCIVIPNCYPDINSPITRKDKELKRIITVGRFHPQKDYETLIKTISILRCKRNDFRLVICGYGKLESEIRKWITNYNIEEVVELYIKPNNIPELLKKSDIYLSTSLYEGTSNSIMEAMNWSLPVVATNVGDNDKLILNGESGIIHEIHDAQGMADSISYLLDNLDIRNKMGLNGNKNLFEHYSTDLFAQKYIEVIEHYENNFYRSV